MAFHDDVDDANDANDKTSSEHEFELPFPKPATGTSPGADSANDTTADGLVDLSEASTDGIFNLDAALNADTSVPAAPPADSVAPPAPPVGASGFAPIDLNEEFQRSDVADALDQGMPPWAMAPAPDPTQAVSQLDAPSDADSEHAVAPSAADDNDDDDPYQIPADYTTPDFFASRISRRRTPEEMEAHAAAVDAESDALATALAAGEAAAAGESATAPTEPAPVESAAAQSAAAQSAPDDSAATESAPVESSPLDAAPVAPEPLASESVEPAPVSADAIAPAADEFDEDLGAFDLGATEGADDSEEFSFESLFATQEPEAAAPHAPAEDAPSGDTHWAEVSPVAGDSSDPISAESDAPANHIWKLGPLEPNVQGSTPAPAPVEEQAAAEAPLPVEEVIDGAPMWNLDGKDAPAVVEAPSLNSDGFLSLDEVLTPDSDVSDIASDATVPTAEEVAPQEDATDSTLADADASTAADDDAESSEFASAPSVASVSAFDLDAAFREAADPEPSAENSTSEYLAPPTPESVIEPEYVAAPADPADSVAADEPASTTEPEPIEAFEEATEAVAEEPLDVFFPAPAAETALEEPEGFGAVESAVADADDTAESNDAAEPSEVSEPSEVAEVTDAAEVDSPFTRRQSFIAPADEEPAAIAADAVETFDSVAPTTESTAAIAEVPEVVEPVNLATDAVESAFVSEPETEAELEAEAETEAASEATSAPETEIAFEAVTLPEAPSAPEAADVVAPAFELPAEPFVESAEPAEPVQPSPVQAAPFVSSFAPEASFVPVAEPTPAAEEIPAAPNTPVADESATAEAPAASEEQPASAETATEDDVPTPPTRRSMADEDILNWADSPENQSTGTLSVIEVLEAQLRLREEEAREYREWETTFRSRGGPVADQVIEQVRSEFSEVVDHDEAPSAAAETHTPVEPQAETAHVDIDQAASHSAGTASESADAPPAVPEESSATVAPAPAPAAAQLPSWDVPPPSESWSPPADFEDEIPFAAHADPTGSITIPVLGDDSEQPSNEQPSVEQPAAPAAATEPIADPAASSFDADSGFLSLGDAPEAPAGEAEAAETPDAAIVPEAPVVSESFAAPELPFATLPAAAPEAPAAPEATDETAAPAPSDVQAAPEFPADEDGDYDEVEFAPPALVEPDVAPSIPRANLDEHVSFGDFGFAPPPADGASDEVNAEAASAEFAVDSAADESDAPFAFDLQADLPSTAASTPAEAPIETEQDSAETTAVASEPVSESVPDDSAAATATTEGAAAFSFASTETPKYVASEPISFDDLLKTDDIVDADVDSDADEADVDPLQALLANAAPPLHGDPLSEVQTGSMPIAQAAFEADESGTDDAVDDSDRLSYPTELSTAAFSAGVRAAPIDSAAPIDNAGAENVRADNADDEIPFAAGAAGAALLGGAAVAGASLASQPAPTGAPAPLAAPPITESSAAAPAPIDSMPQPVAHSTSVVAQQPLGLDEVAPTAQRVFSLEESGLEPTPVDRRIGHAARLFWLWFAANSSIVSLGLGAAVFAVGMSLRQSIVAILAGVALSFIPLGLTTLAGKRSGQPTMVVSRSTFGLLGNIAPSAVALVARLFWGAVLLWVLASSVAIVLIGSDLNGGLGDRQLLLIALALSFLIALVIAFAGYPLFARIQLILSIISGVLIVGLIGFTAQYIDVSQALTTPDGSWLLTVTGAVLVFSFLGLVWAYSGADIARYQRPSSSGPASMLSATFGAALPAFVLIAYGALLAASDPAIARGFLASPLDTLLLLLPSWYPIPLLLAAALSLLSGITLSLYSGGFALQAIGVRVPRQWSIVIVAVVLGALGILFAFGIDGGINELFRDVATTLAVPTAAWAGIFASETMIRTRKLDSAGLLARGGVYADVRWVNLGAYIVISVIGFALTSATISWLSWQGYGFTALGVDLSSDLAGTDLGVLVALGLGILTPLVAGIPAIRRQEAEQPERAPRPA
ncbi:cytosine permease [Salinibacterium sp. NSLL150]|uniref:cytosine permease n=1 Tax=unclassified Salinibacterium TaxID=2632331 RepID=UPI0018CFA27B|nr:MULTISPECIES: cytosine permease [unclassified Salinibacterium]MBH0098986.1 cytosine permease [Salinibacterium sp. NSLL35]MBH0101740.1 cytosine permease [Salinibacterium sp. NSLL150]MBH0104500.1 cytosine permease [Salinibacterium sp. NSLL16]MBH0107260.1 cytosine permease [Salinibacterium sp. NSLL17]